jgi:hypothetical protein
LYGFGIALSLAATCFVAPVIVPVLMATAPALGIAGLGGTIYSVGQILDRNQLIQLFPWKLGLTIDEMLRGQFYCGTCYQQLYAVNLFRDNDDISAYFDTQTCCLRYTSLYIVLQKSQEFTIWRSDMNCASSFRMVR